jgi:hypothetical protein
MEIKQDIEELVAAAKKVASAMKQEEDNQPDKLVNHSLALLDAANRRALVYQFCHISDQLGFTREQIERMIRNIPLTS